MKNKYIINSNTLGKAMFKRVAISMAIILSLITLPIHSTLSQTYRGKLMMCDTPEQIVQLVGLRFGDGHSDEESLQAVNSMHGNEPVCGMVTTAYDIVESVVKFDLMDYTIEVFKIQIHIVYSEQTGSGLPVNLQSPVFQSSVQVNKRAGIPG